MALDTRVPIDVDCVSKSFGARRVLTSASLRAERGEITGLLGRNGSGKTTLLRILVGMTTPDNGVLRIDGVGQLGATTAELAQRGVFYLPARDLLVPALSVRAQLESIRDRFTVHTDVEAIARTLGIFERLQQKPHTLSGGERRRAELAVALSRAPSVLIADEPLRGITPIDAEVIMGALKSFARAGGAVIVTGHELPLLLPHLDRVVWCYSGTTREFPTVASAQADFSFRTHFMP